MSYTKQTWADAPTGGTPITAARLNYMENGIADAATGTGGGGTDAFDVTTYGATGDGTTNDTAAVQTALDAADTAGGGVVHFPRGTYICGNLTARSNTAIVGEGASVSIIRQVLGAQYALSVNPGSGGTPDPAQNTHDVAIRDIGFRGTSDVDGFSEQVHLLNMNAVSRVDITRCHFIGFRGDAIYLGSGNTAGIERHNKSVQITHCYFDGLNKQNRNGVSVIDGEDVLIRDNRFYRLANPDMPGGVDIEPNPGSTWAVCRDIRILDNDFEDIDGFTCISISIVPDQITVTNPARDILIEGNTFNTPNAAGVTLRSNTTDTLNCPQNNITIRRNVSVAGEEPYIINGVRGVHISDNVWANHTLNTTFGGIYPCRDVYVHNDLYYQVADATTGNVHRIYTADNVEFESNRYVNCGRADGTLGIIVYFVSQNVSTAVNFIRNAVAGSRTTSVATAQGGALHTPATNKAYGNDTGALVVATTAFSHPDPTQLVPSRVAAASATLAMGDADQTIRSTTATASTFTVPPNSAVAFPVGTVINLVRQGAGTLTIAAGSGVTVNAPSLTARAQYSLITLWQYAANTWLLSGDLT